MKRRDYIWTNNFAYAVGLIAADGNLSKDGRHIIFTSKDLELVEKFKKALNLNVKISQKSRDRSKRKIYYFVQFSDVNLYRFLLEIGLMPNKSKKVKNVSIPEVFFFDFLRGLIDGDGNINVFFHPQSKLPQLKVRIISASSEFIFWLKNAILQYGISGFLTKGNGVKVLVYAKHESIALLNLIYYPSVELSLGRKRERAKPFLRVW